MRGFDLSPHFVAVGRKLLALAREGEQGEGGLGEGQGGGGGQGERWRWVQPRSPCLDRRVTIERADAARTGLADGVADVVSLSLVIHELPPEATLEIVDEARRLLKPAGQLWITEMDFETSAFQKLRANPVLFSLIRATEPYLDVYADFQPGLPLALAQRGFKRVALAQATGRHFALVATKGEEGGEGGGAPMTGVVEDLREEVEDTHLMTWEAKREVSPK